MVRVCSVCTSEIGAEERATPLMPDGVACPTCTRLLLQESIQRMSSNIHRPVAAIGYLVGGAVGAALYAASVAYSGWDIALVAIAIPWLGVRAMDRLQGVKRGLELQAMAVTLSTLLFGFSRVLTSWILYNQLAKDAGEPALTLLQLPEVAPALLAATLSTMDLLWVGIVAYFAWRGVALPSLPGDKPPEPSRVAKTIARWGAPGAAIIWLLTKGKWLLAAAKFLKLGTLGTMLLSFVVYGQFFGWAMGAGLVLLIFVHEMGHAVAMKRMGVPFSAPVFIPFVGAWIAMKDHPKDAWVEAVVGIGGPVLGSLGAAVCLLLAMTTGSDLMYVWAAMGFLLNLFNLVPISPLDGGRIVGVFGRWLWGLGYLLGFGLFLVWRSPILILILLMGLMSLGRLLRPPPGYHDVAPWKKWSMASAYGGLIVALIGGLAAASAPLAYLMDGNELSLLALFGLAPYFSSQDRIRTPRV